MGGYRRATLGALVDALLPRTPELAATLGPEHVTGGTDVGLAEYLVEAFDGYQEHHLGPLSTLLRRFGVRNYPYSLLVALLLDVVAVELLVRGDNEESVEWWSLATPFARLGRTDRLRAIELLEEGALDSLATRTEHRLPVLGTVRFLALGATTFPLLGYYSEWPGSTAVANPAWQQVGYPGPQDGFAAHRGYEVEEFDEWDWDDIDRAGPDDRREDS